LKNREEGKKRHQREDREKRLRQETDEGYIDLLAGAFEAPMSDYYQELVEDPRHGRSTCSISSSIVDTTAKRDGSRQVGNAASCLQINNGKTDVREKTHGLDRNEKDRAEESIMSQETDYGDVEWEAEGLVLLNNVTSFIEAKDGMSTMKIQI
jgi:hypothetical protein